jgi:hypothetical protein
MATMVLRSGQPKVNASNLVNYIMEYENGTIRQEDFLQLFSYLIKTGYAWQLQGSIYGRPAASLIERGIISKSGEINRKKLGRVI